MRIGTVYENSTAIRAHRFNGRDTATVHIGKNTERDIAHPDWGVSLFSSALPGIYRDNSSTRPRPLPSKFFPVHHVSVLPFDAVYHRKIYHKNITCAVKKLATCICMARFLASIVAVAKNWKKEYSCKYVIIIKTGNLCTVFALRFMVAVHIGKGAK
jgi:hypothetical protein